MSSAVDGSGWQQMTAEEILKMNLCYEESVKRKIAAIGAFKSAQSAKADGDPGKKLEAKKVEVRQATHEREELDKAAQERLKALEEAVADNLNRLALELAAARSSVSANRMTNAEDV